MLNLGELRRLEAKRPWDINDIDAVRNALPKLLKTLETPVAWRTRQRVGPYAPYSWVYTDKQAVTSDDDVYETMPLFALPPHGGVDVG